MTEIRVKSAKLLHAETEINAALSMLGKLLGELDGELNRLRRGWQSSHARIEFDTRQNKWREGAAQLERTLGQIKGAVAEARIQYQMTEQKNAGRFPARI